MCTHFSLIPMPRERRRSGLGMSLGSLVLQISACTHLTLSSWPYCTRLSLQYIQVLELLAELISSKLEFLPLEVSVRSFLCPTSVCDISVFPNPCAELGLQTPGREVQPYPCRVGYEGRPGTCCRYQGNSSITW